MPIGTHRGVSMSSLAAHIPGFFPEVFVEVLGDGDTGPCLVTERRLRVERGGSPPQTL